MCKKYILLLLAVVLIFTLAACGKEEAPKNEGSGWITDGIVFEGSDTEKLVELGTPNAQLDPQAVYSKLTYTPEMFYGDYRLFGGDEAEEKFGAESNYFTWNQNGKETEHTTLPYRIQAGRQTMAHSINYVEGYNWMKLYFMKRVDDGKCYLDTVICAYEIDGNKLIVKPLDSFNVDQENNKITYTFTDLTWEYTFAFCGRSLTLSSGSDSVTLLTCLDPYGKEDYYQTEGYLSSGSKSIDNIDKMSFRYDGEESRLFFVTTDETWSYNSIAVWQENGLFTFTLALEGSVKTYQYVCFCGGYDGFVLTDGTDTYYYNATYRDRNSQSAAKFLTEDQTAKLEDLSDAQLEAIVEKTENLLEDLAAAYQKAGLNVTVNTDTGEIALDSTVLFGVNESEISSDGKEFLQKFMGVYTSVVFDQKYEGFISKIMVEGHTDTNGSYELNKTLSEARANSVRDYCLSTDCGVDSAYTGSLQTMLEAIGYSYDKPIYKENGEVDMDASRRVSFRFIINLGE